MIDDLNLVDIFGVYGNGRLAFGTKNVTLAQLALLAQGEIKPEDLT